MENIETKYLEIVKESVCKTVGDMGLPIENFDIKARSMSLEGMGEELVLTLTRSMAKEDLGFVEVSYPKDWIQAVKERFAPNWLKEITPVEYEVKRVGAEAFYDNIALRHHEHRLKVFIQGRE